MASRKRGNPVTGDVPKMSEHERMVNEMNSALYTLSGKVRKRMPDDGEKLLPENLREKGGPEVAAAKKHIERLYRVFKEEK